MFRLNLFNVFLGLHILFLFEPTARAELSMNRTFVYAKLLEKIRPVERGDRYEEPLDAELKRVGYGECDGGGTLQAKDGEIEYIGLDIQLNDLKVGIPFVIKFLESKGVAAGSTLEFEDGGIKKEIPFGKIEGIGVYLDGVNLAPEVYKSCDVNVVIQEIEKLIGSDSKMRAYWEGRKETALYFYGPNAKKMKSVIGPFLDKYPLCKNARVVELTVVKTKETH
jgi:hypothetical protein